MYKKNTKQQFSPTALLNLRVENVLDSFNAGFHRSVRSGAGLEFLGLRQYDPSTDQLSQIDWLASARTENGEDEPLVRTFHAERKIEVVCMIDVSSAMQFPVRKQEYVSFIAHLFAFSAFRHGDSFRLLLFSFDNLWDSDRLSQPDQFEAFWEDYIAGRMKAYQSYGASNLSVCLANLELHDAVFVLVSDFSPFWDNELETLKKISVFGRNVKTVLCALDEWEGYTPHSFWLNLRDPITGLLRPLSLWGRGSAMKEKDSQRYRLVEVEKIANFLSGAFIKLPLITEDLAKEVHRGFIKAGFE